MKANSIFRRKRVLLPLLSLVILVVAAFVAIILSDASHVIVYNQTGASIAALKVTACGQTRVFLNLDDQDSFRWKLAPTGELGEIALETAADPPWRWQGSYIQPRGGFRVTLRLWPDGEVEAYTQMSLWQRLFHDAPNITD
jgi:hypothetical protein